MRDDHEAMRYDHQAMRDARIEATQPSNESEQTTSCMDLDGVEQPQRVEQPLSLTTICTHALLPHLNSLPVDHYSCLEFNLQDISELVITKYKRACVKAAASNTLAPAPLLSPPTLSAVLRMFPYVHSSEPLWQIYTVRRAQ